MKHAAETIPPPSQLYAMLYVVAALVVIGLFIGMR